MQASLVEATRAHPRLHRRDIEAPQVQRPPPSVEYPCRRRLNMRRISVEFPARMQKHDGSLVAKLQAVRHFDYAVAASYELEIYLAPHARPRPAPSSTKMSQLRGSPLARAGNSGDVSSCGRARRNTVVLRAVALRGNWQMQTMAENCDFDSRLLHWSCETQGSSGRIPTSSKPSPSTGRRSRCRSAKDGVGSASTSVPADPSSGNLILLQRPAQILRDMQNIRCNDQVERMRIEIPCSSGSRSISSARHRTNGYFENLCCALRGAGETSVNTYSVQWFGRTGRIPELVMPPVPPPTAKSRMSFPLGGAERSRRALFAPADY